MEAKATVAGKSGAKSEVHLVKALIAIVVGVIVGFLPAPGGLTADTMKFIGVFAAMIVGLLSRAAPNWLVTIACCMAMILLKLCKIGVILSNFSSNNIWLPMAIVGFAGCLVKCGILSRIALNVFKIFPTTFFGDGSSSPALPG